MNKKIMIFLQNYLILIIVPLIISFIKILTIWDLSLNLIINYFNIYLWGFLWFLFYSWLISKIFLNIFFLLIFKGILVYFYINLFKKSKKLIIYITSILLFEEVLLWLIFEKSIMWF